MAETSNQTKSDEDNLQFIFIGEHISPLEIQIDKIPTFYDVLQLSRNQISIKEDDHYQYLNLDRRKQIQFKYMDGIEEKSGMVSLNKDYLQLTMDQPLNSFQGYILIKKGRKVSYLTFSPNNKIKLKQKDALMHHVQTKQFE